jgi:serine/threonine-protein kinase/endoribonuclease IRE1
MTPAALVFTLLVVAATCLATGVSSRSLLDEHDLKNELSTDLFSPRLKSSAAGYRFLPPRLGPLEVDSDNLQLLDIVIVASVDGRLHALNRASGQALWSMAPSATSPIPSTLAPLVRTVHIETDPDITDEDSPHQEIYIIEPQSGDIYVMSSPDSPLQRLPFSMAQLVDMSPFSFAGDDDRRVFVGRKETSLMSVQLATGKVMGVIDTACPWDPLDNLAGKCNLDSDMEDLDDTETRCTTSSEVFIGRTG